jgi:hypothetical protein
MLTMALSFLRSAFPIRADGITGRWIDEELDALASLVTGIDLDARPLPVKSATVMMRVMFSCIFLSSP